MSVLNASQMVDCRSASLAVSLNALGVILVRLFKPGLSEHADNKPAAKIDPRCAIRI